jgi:E3 ubiquitin-protein ligase NEDD4
MDPSTEMLTMELKKSNDSMPVSGKIIIHLSTNTSTPLSNPGPSQLAGSSLLNTLPSNASAVSLVPPGTASSSNTPATSTGGAAASNADPSLRPEATSLIANGDAQRSGTSATNGPNSSADRNFSATEDQYGPLPQGWERRTDHLGRTYYVCIGHHQDFSSRELNTRTTQVDHNRYQDILPSAMQALTSPNSRTTTWTRPSSNQSANVAEQRAEADASRQRHNRTILADDLLNANNGADLPPPPSASAILPSSNQTTNGSGPLPPGWEERFTSEGRAYYVSHLSRTTTWVDPRRQQIIRVLGPNGNNLTVQPQPVSQLGPLPSGWEMRLTSTARVYFVDHSTSTVFFRTVE